jgi:phospholipase/carboxylesterase
VAAEAAGPQRPVGVLGGGYTHGVLSMGTCSVHRANRCKTKFKMRFVMRDPIQIQIPEGAANRLILLFHGVGSTPESMVPLGARIGREFPEASVVSVPSPDASDMGTGFQWFSVRGITEDNRVGRIAATIPRFIHCIRGLQEATGITPAQTVLIGFSQGAIMALEATQLDELVAGRVVSIAGRFASPPTRAPVAATLHFIHGTNDPVIAYGYAVTAAERLVQLGADVTIDIVPHLAHGISPDAIELLVGRLKGPVAARSDTSR